MVGLCIQWRILNSVISLILCHTGQKQHPPPPAPPYPPHPWQGPPTAPSWGPGSVGQVQEEEGWRGSQLLYPYPSRSHGRFQNCLDTWLPIDIRDCWWNGQHLLGTERVETGEAGLHGVGQLRSPGRKKLWKKPRGPTAAQENKVQLTTFHSSTI